MFKKEEMKACLAGEEMKAAPAYFFWMDPDFIEKNKSFCEEMHTKYSDDIVQTFPKLIKRAVDPADLEEGEFTDEWGARFCHAPDGVGAHPTKPIIYTMEDWEIYREKFIPLMEEGIFESDAEKIVKANQDHYVLMNIWRTFYERMYMLYGIQELWMDLAMEEELFLALLRDLKEFTIRAIKLAKRSGVDGVYLADDWGMQDRLQISPTHWKQYFKPAYADMIAVAHELGMEVWMHSCGCVDSIIPEFIDIGLDVIGNLQAGAVNLKEVSERYRGQITFFGGLDVQSNLVMGTPETVRREVERLTEMFQPQKGRFIYAPSNSIMPETPITNVAALFEAIDTCRRWKG